MAANEMFVVVTRGFFIFLEILAMNKDMTTLLSANGFSERDQRLMENSLTYANSDPAGLPAYNSMLIISKLMILIMTLLNFPLESEVTRELATRSLDGEMSPELLALMEVIKASLIEMLKENDAPWIVIKAFDSISPEWVWSLLMMIWRFLLKRGSSLVAEIANE